MEVVVVWLHTRVHVCGVVGSAWVWVSGLAPALVC
jgi:hypothetical protein